MRWGGILQIEILLWVYLSFPFSFVAYLLVLGTFSKLKNLILDILFIAFLWVFFFGVLP